MSDRGTLRVDTGYKPRHIFMPFHTSTKRFSCLVAHRRAGKTVSCLNDLIKAVVTCPLPNPRGAYIAPTYAQAKDVAWMYLREYTRGIPGVRYHESELRVDLPNGARIRLYGAENYDRLRGLYFDYVVVDEVADMKPEAWTEVIRPTLTDRRGRATFIGTPKGRNLFYDIYRMAEKNPEMWFAAKYPVNLTDILDEDEIEDAKLSMPPSVFAREYMCDFSVEASNQLISLHDCEQSIARTEARKVGPVVIGVDVARFGDDRTVIIVRDGDVISEIFARRGDDLMMTANNVFKLASPERYNAQRIFVDGAGVGGGVVDRLKQMGMINVSDVNSGRRAMDEQSFVNLRAECWAKMCEWLKTTGQIPDMHEFVDDLCAPTFEYDLRNRIKLEGKDSLRKRGLPSPDLADALALTFAEPVRPRDMRGYRTGMDRKQGGVADPFQDPIFADGRGGALGEWA